MMLIVYVFYFVVVATSLAFVGYFLRGISDRLDSDRYNDVLATFGQAFYAYLEAIEEIAEYVTDLIFNFIERK